METKDDQKPDTAEDVPTCDCNFVMAQNQKVLLIQDRLAKEEFWKSAIETEKAEFEKFMLKVKCDDAMLKQLRIYRRNQGNIYGQSTQELKIEIDNYLKKLSSGKMLDKPKDQRTKLFQDFFVYCLTKNKFGF